MLIPRFLHRRKTWIIAIITIGSVGFIFQLLGLRILSSWDSKPARSWYDKNRPKTHPVQVLIGVQPSDLSRYKPNHRGYVECLDHSELILFSKINDNFCDCIADGSDEPGTDACPNGRFYCPLDKKFIPAGKVNDGICDCCDGSEEWNQTMTTLKVQNFPRTSRVHVVPCKNLCADIPGRAPEKDESSKLMGARLKQRYMKAGRGHQGAIFGANGEYYLLSMKCFKFDQDGAQYNVCPFRSIVQERSGHSFSLGKGSSWELEAKADGKHVLIMAHGDRRSCPHGEKRKSYVYFTCGVSDEIVSVKETEQCVYMLTFTTPAAC